MSISSLVGLSALATFLSYADRTVISMAVIDMGAELGWVLADKSLVLSCFFYGYVLSQLPAGFLAQRWGEQRILGIACGLWSTLTALTPVAARVSLNAVIVCRVLQGVASGVVFPLVYQLFKMYVAEEHHSRALSTIMCGNYAGVMAVLVVTPTLVDRYGWDSAFYLFGSLGYLWTAAWCSLTLPTRLKVPSDVARKMSESRLWLTVARRMLTSQSSLVIFFCHWALAMGQYAAIAWTPEYFHTRWQFHSSDLAFTFIPYFGMALSALLVGQVAEHCVAVRHWSPLLTRRVFNTAGFFGATIFMVLVQHASSPMMALAFICGFLSVGMCTVAGFETNKLELTNADELLLLQVPWREEDKMAVGKKGGCAAQRQQPKNCVLCPFSKTCTLAFHRGSVRPLATRLVSCPFRWVPLSRRRGAGI